MVEYTHLEISRKDLTQLKRLMTLAAKKGKTIFIFKNRELHVPYAKYLIDYLEHEFKKEKR